MALGVDDLGIFGIVVILVLVFVFVLNGLALLVGLAALLVGLIGLVTRILFGRPWLVEGGAPSPHCAAGACRPASP